MSQEHYIQTPFQYYHPDMAAQQKQEHMYMMQAMNMQAAVYEHNAMLMAQQQFHPATPTGLQPSVDFVSSKRPTHRRGPSLAHRRGLSSIDINCTSLNFDMPCTPPLSASSSTLNTPMTVGGASTPLNMSFSAESLYGVKAGCEAEVSAEMLASLDWSNRRSPPLTPVYLGMPLSSLNSTCSEILQQSPCPSLSPSPSPVSSSTPRQHHQHQHSVAGATITTCDPRDLLFTACNASHACTPCDLPAVPSAYSGVQEVQQQLKECESYFCGPVVASAALVAPSAQYAFIGGEQTTVGFPSEFASVPCPELITFNSTADALDILSFTDEDYIENIDFVEAIEAAQVHAVMTPLEGPSKRLKRSDSLMSQMSQVSHMSQNMYGYEYKGEQDEMPFTDYHEHPHMHSEEMHGHPQQYVQHPGLMMMPNGNVGPRRGRKQSLTDDPSKQFRCEVCSRRFRRQEHLKRHFRSLHSSEKPFQCTKCKKSFSRSDNLAQHARTHLPGNQNALSSDDDLTDSSDDLRGELLFNAANSAGSVSSSFSSASSVAATSTSLSSAESSSSETAAISKKRKRTA